MVVMQYKGYVMCISAVRYEHPSLVYSTSQSMIDQRSISLLSRPDTNTIVQDIQPLSIATLTAH